MSGPTTAAAGGRDHDMERAVRANLLAAVEAYADEPSVQLQLGRYLERLDEPLRVAIAGKMKSGKSTLLNALVGEEIAPTDAGECTRVLTWYEHGASPAVTLHPADRPPRQLALRRLDGRLRLDLGGEAPEHVERLVVRWPARALRAHTLIDTPGIDSLSTAVSARTTTFLTPEDEPSSADAVVYLLRHLHASDVRFLEAFRDRAAGRATMVNAIGVLSRADEVGAGRIDALLSAHAIARRYRDDPTVRQLCQTVVPVAGLLAQSARTLRQAEYDAIEVLAEEPRDVTNARLLSVDRFIGADAPVPAEVRAALLERLGIFGVRLAITFVRSGMRDATSLAAELVRRSGLDEVRRVLTTQFAERSSLLKARSALLGLERILRDHPRPGTDAIAMGVEQIFAGAHEFRELALLSALRTAALDLSTEDRENAERLLGGSGTSARARLALPAEAADGEVRAAALDAVRAWRTRAESPLTDRVTAEACHVLARSGEGVLASVSG